MVYGSGLENQRGCKPTVGSNPTLSVQKPSPRLGFLMSRRKLRPWVRYRCRDRNQAKRWHDSLIRSSKPRLWAGVDGQALLCITALMTAD